LEEAFNSTHGVSAVPLRLNDETDWERLAEETQILANRECDPQTKAWLCGVIAEYERLARRATALKNETECPLSWRPLSIAPHFLHRGDWLNRSTSYSHLPACRNGTSERCQVEATQGGEPKYTAAWLLVAKDWLLLGQLSRDNIGTAYYPNLKNSN
jgi:hypothetical protein